jgi:hypothetical protein
MGSSTSSKSKTISALPHHSTQIQQIETTPDFTTNLTTTTTSQCLPPSSQPPTPLSSSPMTVSTLLYDLARCYCSCGTIANLNRPTSSNPSSRPQRSRRSSPSGPPCSPRCAYTDTLVDGIGCLIREIGSRGQGCQGPAPERRLGWRRCCCSHFRCRWCCGRR